MNYTYQYSENLASHLNNYLDNEKKSYHFCPHNLPNEDYKTLQTNSTSQFKEFLQKKFSHFKSLVQGTISKQKLNEMNSIIRSFIESSNCENFVQFPLVLEFDFISISIFIFIIHYISNHDNNTSDELF